MLSRVCDTQILHHNSASCLAWCKEEPLPSGSMMCCQRLYCMLYIASIVLVCIGFFTYMPITTVFFVQVVEYVDANVTSNQNYCVVTFANYTRSLIARRLKSIWLKRSETSKPHVALSGRAMLNRKENRWSRLSVCSAIPHCESATHLYVVSRNRRNFLTITHWVNRTEENGQWIYPAQNSNVERDPSVWHQQVWWKAVWVFL